MNEPATLEQPPARYMDGVQLVDEAKNVAQAFSFSSQPPNTCRTYQTAMLYWSAWHLLRYGAPLTLPLTAAVVRQFVQDHLAHHCSQAPGEATPFIPSSHTSQHRLPLAIDILLVRQGYKNKLGAWSLATVDTRLAALSRAHRGLLTNPLRDPSLRQFISSVRRGYARLPPDHAQPRAVAATQTVMRALLATCGDELLDVRDRALLLFGFASGGRRRSEIVIATLENVRRDNDEFIYKLPGAADPKPIQGEAAAALEEWLQALFRAKITAGPIFRRIVNGHIREPLRAAAVRDIIRRRARMSDQPLGRLTAHSLRSGFAVESGRQNIAIGDAMTLSGHRSVQTFAGYYTPQRAAPSAAGRLMESKK